MNECYELMIERNYVTEMGTMSICSLELNWKVLSKKQVFFLIKVEVHLMIPSLNGSTVKSIAAKWPSRTHPANMLFHCEWMQHSLMYHCTDIPSDTAPGRHRHIQTTAVDHYPHPPKYQDIWTEHFPLGKKTHWRHLASI